MALPLPSSLTPSKVSSFKDCALAFRFSVIDKLPEPPSPHAVKGTLVHRALELLMWDVPAGSRTLERGLSALEVAHKEMREDPEFAGLELTDEQDAEFVADAQSLVRNYFSLEDPNTVSVVGAELMMEVELGTMKLRGIIDRLERDRDGNLVVTDYKTGKAPSENYERLKLGGVQFYAYLCEQLLGERPAKIQLYHLREPLAIVAEPSEQTIKGIKQRTQAIWTAVERACQNDDFRPKTGPLCNWCAFQQYCPAFGGDPEAVRRIVEERELAEQATLGNM